MSQHHQTHKTATLDPNLAAFIFIVNFFLIGGLIFANMPAASDSEDGETIEIAMVVPTDTPLPPTATLTLPTQTPIPLVPPAELPATISAPQGAAGSGHATTADSGSYDPALVERGQTLYIQCSACHGPDARGLPNLGKNLVESEFVAAQTDAALVQFIITGRPIWDPLNTTGIDMPGKGGNPAMTTEDIEAIVAYIRTLAAGNG